MNAASRSARSRRAAARAVHRTAAGLKSHARTRARGLARRMGTHELPEPQPISRMVVGASTASAGNSARR